VKKNWQAFVGISSRERTPHSGQLIVAEVTTADTAPAYPWLRSQRALPRPADPLRQAAAAQFLSPRPTQRVFRRSRLASP
jgi:hypothetical protein